MERIQGGVTYQVQLVCNGVFQNDVMARMQLYTKQRVSGGLIRRKRVQLLPTNISNKYLDFPF